MKFPILYKKNKDNSIQKWQIWTTDHDAIIYTEYGKIEGKIQLTSKIAKGKNTGKSNETTSAEQAESDAQSMWNKKKDKGYFLTIKEAEEKVVNAEEIPTKLRGFWPNAPVPSEVARLISPLYSTGFLFTS